MLLIAFACLAAIYMGFMMSLIFDKNPFGCFICGLCALCNFLMMFGVILSDPGVPLSIYHRYSNYNKFKIEDYDQTSTESDIEMENVTELK